MTIPTLLTQGATTHIKDGLPVTTVSNLGALTQASEELIMQIKETADKALKTAEGGGGGGGGSSEELEEVKQIANEANDRSLSNKVSIDSLTTSLNATNSTLNSYISATDARLGTIESSVTATNTRLDSVEAETLNKKADRDLNNVSRNLLSGYEFSVVQETVVANQAYSLDLPHAIDCSKYKVEAVIEFKSIVGNFEVGDRVPLNTCWGMNYRSISYWYNNTKVGFGSSDQISCLPRGTSNGNTNVASYIRVIFEFYKIKD